MQKVRHKRKTGEKMNLIMKTIKILTVIMVISTVHLVSAEMIRATDSILISFISGILFWGCLMIFMDFRNWVIKKDLVEGERVK